MKKSEIYVCVSIIIDIFVKLGIDKEVLSFQFLPLNIIK